MTFFSFASVKLSLCLILGILIGFYFKIEILTVFIGLIILLATLFLQYKTAKKNIPYFELTTAFVTILLGIFIITLSQPKNLLNHYSNVTFNGVKTWKVKIDEVLKSNSYSDRYYAKTLDVNHEKVFGKFLLTIYRDSINKKLAVDDELLTITEINPIKSPLNPHQFNYRNYLKTLGIYHQINTNYNEIISLKNSTPTIYGIAANFREKIISKLKEKDFGEEELSVIQALLLGQRNDISESTYTDYKNAGAVHILALSGLHIGIILMLLEFLLAPLERLLNGKKIKLSLIVFLLWCFAFIAGLSPSIVRATTMFTFLAYALYLNRPSNTLNIIALSMFFILLIKPMFLFQVGFQMSYAAVFSVAWVYPKLQRFWYPENILVKKIWQLLSVSVAAQLGVLPISLFYFHQFPALFFISNLVVIPFLGVILGIGFFVVFLAILNQLPSFLVVFYNFLIQKMNFTISWIAKQEGFIFKEISFDWFQLVFSFLLIISGIQFLSKPKFKNIAPLLFTIIGLQVWGVWAKYQTKNEELFLIAHQTKNTILLHQNGDKLDVISSDNRISKNITSSYKIAKNIDSVSYNSIKNSYRVKNESLYIMDSLGVYPTQKLEYLLLTQSPKINLERLLDSVHPKQLIVDGSNYRSYISRWKKTCEKRKIPFHYTGEKGAFYIPL